MRTGNNSDSVTPDRHASMWESTTHHTANAFPFVPVHEQIHQQAMKHPNKAAVICSGKRMSFRELDEQSDTIATELIRKQAGRDDLVAVLFEREATAYVAEIAVLKSSAGFMPFVPEFPDDRIDYCMKDSGSRLLLTTRKLKETRHFHEANYEVIAVEDLLENGEPECQDSSFPKVSGNDLAYCIYTSGTTGRPKGVLIEHRNIANFVSKNEKSIDIMYFAKPGRISLALAAFSFDFSLEEALVPLCSGNTVVLATTEQIHDPIRFADLVIQTGVDTMACTPTYLCGLLSVRESREALRQIKLFHLGGEAFPKRLYSRLRELSRDSVIMNVYGPTECTIISSASVVTDDEEITVGKPRANTQFFVLDALGNELPVGQKGELIICGDQVGRGYIGQSDPDGAFFSYRGMPAYHTGDLAVWTDTGEIRILGRIDSQVKLRGYRIELNEIEAVMSEYPAIHSAVAALKRQSGAVCLVGYYMAAEAVDSLLLKRHLRSKLPDYMIPNVFMRIEELPFSINGKIDREALPEPCIDERKARYIPPESEREKKLCLAMEKVLHRAGHSVGLMDDFFDLAGDSISAMELLEEADIEGLEYADIFNFRTPAEILGELKRRETERQPADMDRIERDARLASHRLTPVQRELMDVQRMVPRGATVSSIRFLMRLGDAVDAERFCQALNTVLAHHPGFAMKFILDADQKTMQRYDPLLIPKVTIHELLPEEEDALADTLIRPFDELLGHSLCRVNLFRGREGLYFFMDVHHMLADGFSQRPFFRNIVDAYDGRKLKKDRYLALLALEEQRALEGQYEADKAYLLRRYAGYDWCVTPFVKDPASDERGGTFCRHLRFTEGQLREAAERLSVSFSVMHIASILLAMYHMTGKRDVMAFWTFHDRPTKEAEDAVGMLMKTLPVGVHMNEIQSLQELLLSVREQVVSGVAHSAYSYLLEQVFSRRIVWIESNHQIHMDDSEFDVFAPEQIELHNAYTDTADNVMLAFIYDNARRKDTFDFVLDHGGKGVKAADVERLHREIYEILEAIVLDETIRL